MTSQDDIFGRTAATDDALAQAVAQALDMAMPQDCVAGVAMNVRLLDRHVATLRGAAR